jgi:hypothetical protein
MKTAEPEASCPARNRFQERHSQVNDLLHFGKEVLRITVKFEVSYLDQRMRGMRPDFGEIERIDRVGVRLALGQI